MYAIQITCTGSPNFEIKYYAATDTTCSGTAVASVVNGAACANNVSNACGVPNALAQVAFYSDASCTTGEYHDNLPLDLCVKNSEWKQKSVL
jgi:hypothetical protein